MTASVANGCGARTVSVPGHEGSVDAAGRRVRGQVAGPL